MSERFKTKSAVMLILFRNSKQEVLLQKRQNTGYMDNYWDFSATGHVENNESMKQATIREAKEEIGIDIKIEDIHIASIAHKYSENSGIIYYNGYFYADKYQGNPSIQEEDKCSALKWFSVSDLPQNVIPDRLIALEEYQRNNPYHEIGWDALIGEKHE